MYIKHCVSIYSSRFAPSTARTQGMAEPKATEVKLGRPWPQVWPNTNQLELRPNLGLAFAKLGPLGSNLAQLEQLVMLV